jgi:hypothetical protein
MDHTTPLQKLPDGIVIPAHLSDRIAYDSERRQLTFRGFMTKYTHDELVAIANDQPYRAAVQRLFVLSSQEFTEGTSRRTSPLILAGAALGIIAFALFAAWTMVLRSSIRNQDSPESLHSANATEGNPPPRKTNDRGPTLTTFVGR